MYAFSSAVSGNFFLNSSLNSFQLPAKFLIDEYVEGYKEEITPTRLTQSLKKYADFKNLSLVDEQDKKLKSKVYILTNQQAKTLSEMKRNVSYEDNLNII